MFACDSAATARASRSNRCRSALGASVFTATRRASSRSSASHTALIAPRPSGSSRRYRPATSSSLIGRDYRDRCARPPDDRRGAGARARARRGRCRTKTSPSRTRRAACSRRPRSHVVDLPPFPSSAMDGYAVRAADTPGLARRRRASRRPDIPRPSTLAAGQAIAISTGAVVPGRRRRGRAGRAHARDGERGRGRAGPAAARTSVRAAATSPRATPSSLRARRAARRSSARSPRSVSSSSAARAARASPCSRPAASFAAPARRSAPARSTSRTR